MNITLMEKVYEDNEYALYINGLVGTVSDNSIISSVDKVLTSLGYNIVNVNCIMTLNESIPNNEADYKHEGKDKFPITLSEEKWEHYCSEGCCFDTGYNLIVNWHKFTIEHSAYIALSEVLSKLGHPVTLHKTTDDSKRKRMSTLDICLDYLVDPIEMT